MSEAARIAAGAARLSEAARVADPDPWRNELRDALDQADKAVRLARLQSQAKTAKFDELGPISLQLLGAALNADGDTTRAEEVLRKAQRLHPGDVWVNYELARVLHGLKRYDEAVRFFTVARAIRPEVAHELAHALEKRDDIDEAIAVFSDLFALRPNPSQNLGCMEQLLLGRRLSRETAAALERAAAVHRETIGLQPDDAGAHLNLARVLEVQGHLEEALAEFRTVKRLDPERKIDIAGRYLWMYVRSLPTHLDRGALRNLAG